MAQATGHIVLLGNGTWPDSKQLCVFASRIVKLRPLSLHITIFTNKDCLERAKREVESEVESKALANYVRVVALQSNRTNRLVDPVFDSAFADVYEKLIAGQSFQCVVTGKKFGPLPPPRAVISPNFTPDLVKNLRAQRSQQSVKLLIWYSHTPATLFFFHGPMERGGVGDLRTKLRTEAACLGATEEEVLEETARFLASTLMRVPGYEPIYPHETQPQELIRHGSLGIEWLMIYDMFMACDGVLVSTPELYDPLAAIGNRAWMAESSRGAYAVGPMFSTGAKTFENELVLADRSAEIRDFVSRVLKSHGPKSLLYISFGSAMWPRYPEKLWTFLDTVMELNIPFILSHHSEYADIPKDISCRANRYGLGLLSSWCPQQMILNHPVTGWFVTHGGNGSVMEAIGAGVPMICWPYVGDEALNAIYITDSLKIGYELIQIRTGHGMERIYRTGDIPEGTPEAISSEAMTVLRNAFGQDGARKSANLAKLRARFDEVWEEGGESRNETIAFLDELGL